MFRFLLSPTLVVGFAIAVSLGLVLVVAPSSARTPPPDAAYAGRSLVPPPASVLEAPQPEATPSSKLADIHPPRELVESHEALQSPQEALAEDLRLFAQTMGWGIERAEAHHRADEIMDRIVGEIVAVTPEIYVGAKLSVEPVGTPSLYIKGPADAFVHRLVGDAEIGIRIVDNQPFSFDELEERKFRVGRELEAQGFQDISVGFKVAERGRITAAVTSVPGLPDTAEQILSRFPESLRESVAISVVATPVAIDNSAFGGMRVDPGPCTSGWSVRNVVGMTGVTTGGHCGINQITPPGSTPVQLTFQGEHRGQWGDVEWHTTPDVEPASFYSDADTVRLVTAVEPRSQIFEGEGVCLFGRTSNVRTCSYVWQASIDCTNGGVWNNRLVMMEDVVGMGGDSGGGWSSGNKAYGSQKGQCNDQGGTDKVRATFSVADLYDEALGVTVRLAQTLPVNGLLWPASGSDDRLASADGRFVAAMQVDGNFVIYRAQTWTALWASSQCGQANFSDIHAVLQGDANFVLYPSAGSPARWATSWAQTQPACISNQQTNFGSGAYMVLQNDGNLVIYRSGVGAVWASNTCCY